jgi:hypothetical protein
VLPRKFETLVLGTLGKLCLHPFKKDVLLGVVVLLCSMLECTIDVGKIYVRDSIWVLFKKFQTLVLELWGNRVVVNSISFSLFKL